MECNGNAVEIKTIHLLHFIMHLGKSDRNGENTWERTEGAWKGEQERDGREGGKKEHGAGGQERAAYPVGAAESCQPQDHTDRRQLAGTETGSRCRARGGHWSAFYLNTRMWAQLQAGLATNILAERSPRSTKSKHEQTKEGAPPVSPAPTHPNSHLLQTQCHSY